MTPTRNLRAAVAILTVLALALLASPVLSAPDAQTNLLQNPGFESGSLSGWEMWAIVNRGQDTVDRCGNWERPVFQINSAEMRSGAYAAHYYTAFASHNAGLYQRVSVTPGTQLRFTIWAKAVSADENYQNPDYTAVWIGIDPNGGTDASSGSVVWSGAVYPMSGYMQLAVEATAAADHVTVFTRSQPNWCLAHNDVFFDDASLTPIGSGSAPTTTPGAATPQPGQQPDDGYQIATPDATGRIVHTVQEGDMLGTIAALYGVTVQQIVELNNLPSDDIIVLGQQLLIKPGESAPPAETTEPTEEATEATEPPAEPTAEPATEQPTATGEALGTGTLCVLSYEDVNGNAVRDPQEPNLAGVTFVLSDGAETVSRYTTDGISEPHCFAELLPGAYEVSWTGDHFVPTTDQSWRVEVKGGDILSHEFGAQPRAAAGEVQDERAGSGGLPNWLIALLGSLSVVVVLSAIGLVAYFAVIKPRLAD
ncbi:MAG TPA: LysM peptidoglycan-binding domain-containing protein [Aggregatilineales bacterium]|nr:LysM peptidoglycan-binding domain-containing protein [Chloroflexota bacterium]HOA22660.1 LysM peptidoglycan-binding domain-containing protein [Aggregatilineales bacterium]HQE18799.1 LysM peptidoglycan-binding domain-containing protein [Aggregatilineales bacterium]